MQKNETALGEIYFTKYDKSITGSIRRDPLGLQPIWSYYGRRVVSHLTTVSTDIRGFRELLLCLSICKECMKDNKDESYQGLVLLFEQLFIYSTIEHNMKEGIIGSDNGSSKYKKANGNPEISSTNTILIRELSLGYYGRYRTPMNTMGVVTPKGYVENDIDVKGLYGSELYEKILSNFKLFLDINKSKRRYKDFNASKEILKAVCGKLRNGEEEFWKEKLQIDGSSKSELMNKCYLGVNENESFESVFGKLSYADEVKDVIRLETFIRCLEFVFYQALSSKNISAIEPVNMEEYCERYNEFEKINFKEEKSKQLYDRIKFIKDNCKPSLGKETYIKNVIEYHKLVCRQKNCSVWLELDATGNVQSFIPEKNDIDITHWGRDYYLSSLLNIKKGIEELY